MAHFKRLVVNSSWNLRHESTWTSRFVCVTNHSWQALQWRILNFEVCASALGGRRFHDWSPLRSLHQCQSTATVDSCTEKGVRILPDLFFRLIIKEKKWSDYTRLYLQCSVILSLMSVYLFIYYQFLQRKGSTKQKVVPNTYHACTATEHACIAATHWHNYIAQREYKTK